MNVTVLETNDGRVLFTHDADPGHCILRLLASGATRVTVSIREMSDAEYTAIPATSEAHAMLYGNGR